MNAGDISIPRPASDLSNAKVETWYPYGMEDTEFKNPTELISRQFTLLWDMLSPLGHILYETFDQDSFCERIVTHVVTDTVVQTSLHMISSGLIFRSLRIFLLGRPT
jgi:hypothetical protein